MPENECPLSGHESRVTPMQSSLLTEVRCDTCGRFFAGDISLTRTIDEDQLHVLVALARRGSDGGNPITITSENVESLLESAIVPSTLERMDLSLLYIDDRQPRADQAVQVDLEKDYPLVFAHDANEFRYFLHVLRDRGRLEQTPSRAVPESYHFSQFRLTPEGRTAADRLRRLQPNSNQAFVAMWFDPDLLGTAWLTGIKPALESTGYTPVNMSDFQHSGNVDNRIVAEIRRSGLLVADFTKNRGGVYFEAGFARGLNIPVIWTCKDTDFDRENLHFDVNHFNFIFWSSPEDLGQRLVDRVEAEFPAPGPLAR